MNCEFCQKPTHHWFDCKTKPPGWRPARLAKNTAPVRAGGPDQVSPERGTVKSSAGNRKPRPAKTDTSVVIDPQAESTAARKDVQATERSRLLSDQGRERGAAELPSISSRRQAGNQALPVDHEERRSTQGVTDGRVPSLTAKGTPRKRAPKGTFDRKEYQRVKAIERRARIKAEKEAAK